MTWHLTMVLIFISLCCRIFFHISFGHFLVFFCKMSIEIFCPFLVCKCSVAVEQSSLYILDNNPLLDVWFENIFSHLVDYIFGDHFFLVGCISLAYFCFCYLWFWCCIQNPHCQDQLKWGFPQDFIVSCLPFKCWTFLSWFVCVVWV